MIIMFCLLCFVLSAVVRQHFMLSAEYLYSLSVAADVEVLCGGVVEVSCSLVVLLSQYA